MKFDSFIKACREGDLARVRRGMSMPHIDLRQTDSKGLTPLMTAACKGHREIVKALIPGSDLRQGDRWGNTALMSAAFFGHLEVVRALIAGSDLRQSNSNGDTALILAAFHGRVEVLRALVPGSDLRQQEKDGRTSLMLAACAGHVDVTKTLIGGSDRSQRANDGETALEKAMREKHWFCVDLLAEHDLELGRFAWPADAKAQDLPRWAARLERQALSGEVVSKGDSAVPPKKRRSRL